MGSILPQASVRLCVGPDLFPGGWSVGFRSPGIRLKHLSRHPTSYECGDGRRDERGYDRASDQYYRSCLEGNTLTAIRDVRIDRSHRPVLAVGEIQLIRQAEGRPKCRSCP